MQGCNSSYGVGCPGDGDVPGISEKGVGARECRDGLAAGGLDGLGRGELVGDRDGSACGGLGIYPLLKFIWSSLQIANALCPPFSVSGPIVQCTPVANYPLGVQVEITPTQEGEGDPSLENVRPIVGWDAVNIHQSNGDQDKTYTVQLGQTVYGGTLDVGTGIGSEEWSSVINLSSSNNLGLLEDYANETTMLYYIGNLDYMQNAMLVSCSHLPTINIVDLSNTNIGICGNPDGNMAYIRLSKETASNLGVGGGDLRVVYLRSVKTRRTLRTLSTLGNAQI